MVEGCGSAVPAWPTRSQSRGHQRTDASRRTAAPCRCAVGLLMRNSVAPDSLLVTLADPAFGAPPPGRWLLALTAIWSAGNRDRDPLAATGVDRDGLRAGSGQLCRDSVGGARPGVLPVQQRATGDRGHRGASSRCRIRRGRACRSRVAGGRLFGCSLRRRLGTPCCGRRTLLLCPAMADRRTDPDRRRGGRWSTRPQRHRASSRPGDHRRGPRV